MGIGVDRRSAQRDDFDVLFFSLLFSTFFVFDISISCFLVLRFLVAFFLLWGVLVSTFPYFLLFFADVLARACKRRCGRPRLVHESSTHTKFPVPPRPINVWLLGVLLACCDSHARSTRIIPSIIDHQGGRGSNGAGAATAAAANRRVDPRAAGGGGGSTLPEAAGGDPPLPAGWTQMVSFKG